MDICYLIRLGPRPAPIQCPATQTCVEYNWDITRQAVCSTDCGQQASVQYHEYSCMGYNLPHSIIRRTLFVESCIHMLVIDTQNGWNLIPGALLQSWTEA